MFAHDISLTAALAACVISTAASAQKGDIVMRRPIPKNMLMTGGAGDKPSEQTTVPLSPQDTVCDEGTGAGAKLTSVKWVESGWSDGGMNAESCSVQKMTYTCQATYTCEVGGRTQSFVSDASDSVCETSRENVSYPGETPNPTKFPISRSTADQAAWFTAWFNQRVVQQESGGAPVRPEEITEMVPWVRGVDQIRWWTPGEYSPSGHMRYIRVFINPGGNGLYDASSDLCGKMREAGHPCSNYYSHEGGSVFVAWIIG